MTCQAMRACTLVLVSVAVSALGCGSSGDGAQKTELQVAEATWAATKPSCPQYHYAAETSSVFGFGTTTTVQIAGDQPVRRSFVAYGDGHQADAGPEESWDETDPASVGTHADGAPALTVEQLFTSCRASLARDPGQNTLTLIVGTAGVPTACGYTPKQCVDDCYTGFRLSDFGCGPWPGDGGAAD